MGEICAKLCFNCEAAKALKLLGIKSEAPSTEEPVKKLRLEMVMESLCLITQTAVYPARL